MNDQYKSNRDLQTIVNLRQFIEWIIQDVTTGNHSEFAGTFEANHSPKNSELKSAINEDNFFSHLSEC
jgi:hypothetical protein